MSRAPQALAVQEAGSAAIVDAFAAGGPICPTIGETAADSIAVSAPPPCAPRLGRARVEVSLGQILEAIPALARGSGMFGEPAAAAALAGLCEAARLGLSGLSYTAVLHNAGRGLKDVAAAMKVAGERRVIRAEPAALDALFGVSSPP